MGPPPNPSGRTHSNWRPARLHFWLALSGVSIIVSTGAVYLSLVKTSPLPFAEMDFDGNGWVTFGELYRAHFALPGTEPCSDSTTDRTQRKLPCD